VLPCPALHCKGGWNPAALAAVAAGITPCLPGLLASVGLGPAAPPAFAAVYDAAWFVGVGVASGVYWAAMRAHPRGAAPGGRPAAPSAPA
jgi:NCS1 family nucleobase:cation symporter-1